LVVVSEPPAASRESPPLEQRAEPFSLAPDPRSGFAPGMRRLLQLIALAAPLLLTACAGLSAARRAELEKDAQPALAALQAANFDQARALATEALTRHQDNPRAAAVSALSLYRQTLHDAYGDVLTVIASVGASALMHGDFLNRDYVEFAIKRADDRLAEIDGLLAVSEKDPGFSLELCPACWEVDWNRNGEVDARDRHLLQIELDAQGQELPEGDPRRSPTFRFDQADVVWLRAMVAFQRAALALADAYDPNLPAVTRGSAKAVILRLRDAKQVEKARLLILTGLELAGRCRALVLAETDDDREWLPNPRQKSHALPLQVDDALFETWAGVLDDATRIVKGEQGVSVTELAQLGRHHHPENPPRGFIDLGTLLTQPHDLVLTDDDLEHSGDDRVRLEAALSRLLGSAYKPAMTPSPLLQRLERMRRELDRGEDTLERKLRYLLWLN